MSRRWSKPSGSRAARWPVRVGRSCCLRPWPRWRAGLIQGPWLTPKNPTPRSTCTIAPTARNPTSPPAAAKPNCCQAPGCPHTRFLEIHHITPRHQGGTNADENLTTLCSSCHKLTHDKPAPARNKRPEGLMPQRGAGTDSLQKGVERK
ncbi:hypothetical protein CSA17_06450 [bacterium DOLJORAL78_65_58]|nr:MAG: hypothetical protein CSA17_06450 [bacterium DOLJORAL78_65_58]